MIRISLKHSGITAEGISWFYRVVYDITCYGESDDIPGKHAGHLQDKKLL